MESRKLKVLHIITQLDLGGAQKNALDIVRLLDKDKYIVYLLSSQNGLLVPDALSIPGVKVVLLSSLKHPINPFADLVSLARLTALFKREAIDIVHTHSSKAGILGRWAARLAKAPVIIHTIHGWSFHRYQPLLLRMSYAFLERITAAFTDRLVAVTKSDIQKGLAQQIGKIEQYRLIPYGIDQEPFFSLHTDIRGKKKELGVDGEAQVVGMIACLKPQKAPLDFVRVAALVVKKRPQTVFIMVGEGILRERTEELIAEYDLKDNFVLTGWRRDIPEIMSCLDVLALTSLWEGSPIVFLEGMCSGLPIVAYDVDGAGEVVKDGSNGFLVKPGDVEKMASRIVSLLQDPARAQVMGTKGLDWVMNSGRDSRAMIADISDLYANLAANSGH